MYVAHPAADFEKSANKTLVNKTKKNSKWHIKQSKTLHNSLSIFFQHWTKITATVRQLSLVFKLYLVYSPHCFHERTYTKLCTYVRRKQAAAFMMVKNDDDMLPSLLSSTELFPTYIHGS